MDVEFTVWGKPKGKERPRFSSYGHCYTPKNTKDYEKEVAGAYKLANGKMFADTVQIEINAYFKPPKKFSKADRQMVVEQKMPYTKKPDADNIGKIIMDGLNGVAYEDDNKVAKLIVEKQYGQEDCVCVKIIDIGE